MTKARYCSPIALRSNWVCGPEVLDGKIDGNRAGAEHSYRQNARRPSVRSLPNYMIFCYFLDSLGSVWTSLDDELVEEKGIEPSTF